MNNDITVVLGTAHLQTTPGKCSPDKRLREWSYSREIVDRVEAALKARGVRVVVDYKPSVPNKQMVSPTWKTEQSRELRWRTDFVNRQCSLYGKKKVVYVSIHVNAAGADGNWKTAGGWAVYTSPGKTRADALATCLYEAARKNLSEYAAAMVAGQARGLYDRRQVPLRADYSDGDPDYEARFAVLTNTQCPAALTENLFQDNRTDVEFLLSERGKRAITQLHVDGIMDFIKKGL